MMGMEESKEPVSETHDTLASFMRRQDTVWAPFDLPQSHSDDDDVN